MNFSQLVVATKQKANANIQVSLDTTEVVLKAALRVIKENLLKQEKVQLLDLGILKPKMTKGRNTKVNLVPGAPMKWTPPRLKVTFSMSKSFIEQAEAENQKTLLASTPAPPAEPVAKKERRPISA